MRMSVVDMSPQTFGEQCVIVCDNFSELTLIVIKPFICLDYVNHGV